MEKHPLAQGLEVVCGINSGAKDIIDQIVKKRGQAEEPRRGHVKVVSVTKYPVTHPPRTVATIHLEDGTSHNLIEDAYGKGNYDVSIATACKGDELNCVYPLRLGQPMILVGSEAGAARLR